MLQALLCGKLSRDQENLEDVLTSSVFGPLEYLPAEKGLIPLIQLARFSDGTFDPTFLRAGLEIERVKFWPTYTIEAASTEPDLIIWAREPTGRRHIILIEVKLWSSKSSRPDLSRRHVTDQLAREWSVLVHLCKQQDATPHLIYLTTDPQFPLYEIRESENESRIKHPERDSDYPFRCAWLSWLQISETFMESEEPVLRDISAACRKLGLLAFRGFSALKFGRIDWSFSETQEPYSFALSAIATEWRFR